ncbi:hypothetical protein ES703_33050 [subsurface metagenome]
MVKFLSFLFLFSIPIVLILIVNLKRKQRLIYSHALLHRFQDKSLKDFLLRVFQLYSDIIFDLLLAVILALLLSGLIAFPARRTAVCLDGSYSMTLGRQGQTPLDRALELLFQGERLPDRYDLFLLTFNPDRTRFKIIPIKGWQKLAGAAEAREKLAGSFSFFNVDLNRLGLLFKRGYQRVIYITDRFPVKNTNLEIIEVGMSRTEGFFYPLSFKYDFDREHFQLNFFRQGPQDISIERFIEAETRYRSIPAAKIEMADSAAHFTVILREEGLYRLRGKNMDFGFNLRKPLLEAAVSGRYSRLLLEVLPQLTEGGEDLLLSDLEYDSRQGSPQLKKKIKALGGYQRRIITFLPLEEKTAPAQQWISESVFVHPLQYSLARPSLTPFPEALFDLQLDPAAVAIFYQHPESLLDSQTPVVYASLLEEALKPPFLTEPPRRSRLVHRGLSSFILERKGEYLALNLAPLEFFHLSSAEPLVFPKNRLNRLLFFILLFLLYGLKLSMLFVLQRPAGPE